MTDKAISARREKTEYLSWRGRASVHAAVDHGPEATVSLAAEAEVEATRGNGRGFDRPRERCMLHVLFSPVLALGAADERVPRLRVSGALRRPAAA